MFESYALCLCVWRSSTTSTVRQRRSHVASMFLDAAACDAPNLHVHTTWTYTLKSLYNDNCVACHLNKDMMNALACTNSFDEQVWNFLQNMKWRSTRDALCGSITLWRDNTSSFSPKPMRQDFQGCHLRFAWEPTAGFSQHSFVRL